MTLKNMFEGLREMAEKLDDLKTERKEAYVKQVNRVYQNFVKIVDVWKEGYISSPLKGTEVTIRLTTDMIDAAEAFVQALERSKPIYDASEMIKNINSKKTELEKLLG